MQQLNSMKHILRYLGRFFETFVGFLFIYLVIMLLGASIATGRLDKSGDVCIYVQSNGIHTDICLPVKTSSIDWTQFIPLQDYENSTEVEYIAIGWGDKGFFLDTPTWADLKFSTAINAAFLPSPTAMHVSYSGIPKENNNRKRVTISKAAYQRMISFVKNSFLLKNKQVDLIPNRGYSDHDNFYEAKKSYHMFRTCNIWTNEALKTAGVKTGIYALFPDGILKHLD